MSWNGYIVSTSISTVNSEVGYSSSAQTAFNDTRVRRLSNRTTGSSEIAMSNMRFGLQAPLIVYDDGFYANTARLEGIDANFGFSEAYVEIDLSTTGTGTYWRASAAGFEIVKSFTWLTTGSAGDYTAEFTMESGQSPNEGNAVDTDLSLSGGLFWRWRVTRSLVGVSTRAGIGTLKIKRNGVVGPYRRFDLYAYAERY